MKNNILFTTILLFFFLSGPSLASTYLAYEEWGGTYYDANKTYNDDFSLCWAASASNVLAWSKWGYPTSESFSNENDIFQYYKDHFTDSWGSASPAWSWWFNGESPSMGAQLESPGGGFWKSYDYSTYQSSYYPPAELMPNIDRDLRSGDGVSLLIYRHGYVMGHAITIWGFDYDINELGVVDYTGVYVTDSDDGVAGLRYYGIHKNGIFYDFDLYNYRTDWYISSAFTLDQAPLSTPIPGTLIIFGSGLIGLAGFRKKIKI